MTPSFTSLLRVTVNLTAFLVLATLGPAPIRGDKYGKEPQHAMQGQDEKSLEAQQKLQKTMGQVGPQVALKSEVQMDVPSDSQNAASVLAQAERGNPALHASGAQALGAANARIAAEGSHSWLWTVLLIGGLLAGIVGVKRWADKNIPNVPTVTPKRDGW